MYRTCSLEKKLSPWLAAAGQAAGRSASSSEPLADVRAEAVPKKAGHLSTPHRIIPANPSRVYFFPASCVAVGMLEAGKSHEKTVSFDRETVFTYIKQTPVQTPR